MRCEQCRSRWCLLGAGSANLDIKWSQHTFLDRFSRNQGQLYLTFALPEGSGHSKCCFICQGLGDFGCRRTTVKFQVCFSEG